MFVLQRMMFSATLADKNKVYVVNAPKHVINQLYTIFSNHWSKGKILLMVLMNVLIS